MSKSLDLLLNEKYLELNDSDRLILNYLLNNKNTLKSLSLTQISSRCHVSNSTIVRLAQKLGFSGFSEFKFSLNQNTPSENTSTSYMDALDNDIKETLKLVHQTNLDEIAQTMQNANQLFIYGTDWGERNAANELSRNLLAVERYAVILPSISELLSLQDRISAGDVLIVITFSGNNSDLKTALSDLTLKGVKIISISPLMNNYVSLISNFNMYYYVTSFSTYPGGTANHNMFTTLTIATDALFRKYAELHFQKE